jgi:ribosomal protein L29
MPDTPVERSGGGRYDPALETRVSRLEEDMRDMRATMGRLEISVAEIKAMLEATLPHLATKAELAELRMEVRTGLADKPSKTYMWGVLAALITAYAAGLAALAIVR